MIELISWSGQGDTVSWLLSGILLLLAVTATMMALPQIDETAVNRRRVITSIWLLAAAALPAIWADSPRSLLTGWTILAVTYILISLFTKKQNPLPTIGWFTAVYALLLGATAIAPAEAASPIGVGWELAAYPQAIALLLAAAFVQIGSWPAHHWLRQTDDMDAAQITTPALFSAGIPALVGGMVFARLAATTIPYPALFTLLAAISLLYGVYRLWLPDVAAKREGVLLVAAGMLGQTAIVAGETAVLAELRLLVLAAPLLIMTMAQPPTGKWRKLPPLLAAGAVVGMPLTAGFTGHTALYAAWIADGSIILVAITALLQMIVLATLLTAVLRPSALPSTKIGSTIGWQDIGSGLLAAGLLSFQVNEWLDAGAISWLILLISFVGGGVFFYYMGTEPAWLMELPSTIAQAFAPTATMLRGAQGGRRIITAVHNAISEAVDILEGESGLLWLLAIGLLILLMQ